MKKSTINMIEFMTLCASTLGLVFLSNNPKWGWMLILAFFIAFVPDKEAGGRA